MKVESRSSGYEFDDSLLSRKEEGWGFNLGATVKPTDNLNINLGLIRYDEDENWVNLNTTTCSATTIRRNSHPLYL